MRLGIAPIEKSTRYVDYSTKVNGQYRYYTDPNLKKMGLTVPREVSVVGFGDSNLCEIIEPNLTSVTHEPKIMGEAAAELLFKVIQKRHIPKHEKNLKFDSRVVIRDSSR